MINAYFRKPDNTKTIVDSLMAYNGWTKEYAEGFVYQYADGAIDKKPPQKKCLVDGNTFPCPETLVQKGHAFWHNELFFKCKLYRSFDNTEMQLIWLEDGFVHKSQYGANQQARALINLMTNANKSAIKAAND